MQELKHRHPWAERARECGDTGQLGLIGMQAGCLAGSFAGVATTPLDVAKTRIILTERPADRPGLLQMMGETWGRDRDQVWPHFGPRRPHSWHTCLTPPQAQAGFGTMTSNIAPS